MDYETFRHFADSWMLLAMITIFISIVLWAVWHGGTHHYDDASAIPFRNDSQDTAGISGKQDVRKITEDK